MISGIVLLAVFGWRALRDLRRAPEALPQERGPVTTGARYATAGLGAVIGVGVWATASEESMLALFVAPIVMVGLFAWSIAAYASNKVPALGAIWRWPQWTAFALSSAVLATVMLLTLHTDLMTPMLALFLAAGVTLLFVAVAFVGDRNGR